MKIKLYFCAIVALMLSLSAFALKDETVITYFADDGDVHAQLKVRSSEIKSDSLFMAIVIQAVHPIPDGVTVYNLREHGPSVYFQTDTIGSRLWRVGTASNRTLYCDTLQVPIVFDYEVIDTPNVFKSITVE